MGKWALTITGEGVHNNNRPDDADAIFKRVLSQLENAGHKVSAAVFSHDQDGANVSAVQADETVPTVQAPGDETVTHQLHVVPAQDDPPDPVAEQHAAIPPEGPSNPVPTPEPIPAPTPAPEPASTPEPAPTPAPEWNPVPLPDTGMTSENLLNPEG